MVLNFSEFTWTTAFRKFSVDGVSAWEISRLEICNQTQSFCRQDHCALTKCQGDEMFQRTNRTSDPRNEEKMWHNISSGSVSIEVAISLQHMKLTSGSESASKQMTANFGRYRIQ